jgi:hypothetical protein
MILFIDRIDPHSITLISEDGGAKLTLTDEARSRLRIPLEVGARVRVEILVWSFLYVAQNLALPRLRLPVK